MENNATVGFTFQKIICDKYKIIPKSEQAISQFKSASNLLLAPKILPIVESIFDMLGSDPIECTTFEVDKKNKLLPYNFILKDNSTLSIRTNINGDKIAPRIVGQAGYAKLNTYFAHIYGKQIINQDDIKHLIIENIDKCLPIFFDFLFDADYILWIYQENNEFKYHLIKGDSGVDILYEKDKFSFTKNYDQWLESTTLKYNNVSIAEIQVHKKRSFKFRFIMKNILPLIVAKETNNETIGITAEKTICDIFKLEYPSNFFKRYSLEAQFQMQDCIIDAFNCLPKPVKHTGNLPGLRGGNSKCSYDFVLTGNKTLSVKTNIGKKVCPPEVGQPNDKTCYLYFGKFTNNDHIDSVIFKTMVYEYIDKMLPIYVEHMFDSDYLLRIFIDKENALRTGCIFNYEIFEKNHGTNFKWDRSKIDFSKKIIEEWNESNTLYYDGVSIGEFQVHSHRNCFKFRFNFDNLLKIMQNN